MIRRAALLVLVALGLVFASIELAAQGRAPEPAAPADPAPVASSSSSTAAPIAPATGASGGLTSGGLSSGELFPLVANDPKEHLFQCTGFLRPKLVCVFGPAQRLPSGDYVVYEIREQPYGAAAPQTFGREWLRADEHGVVCAQREEVSVLTVLDPPQRVLDLPLSTGKRWEWKGKASGLACESESTVMGRERLALPYGTVDDCWRVDTVTRGREGDKLVRSVWFAAGLGIVQEVSRIESQGRAMSIFTKLERVGDPESSDAGKKPRR